MDQKDSSHWKLGVFYFNPENKSVFVPKRFGWGWTFNFAHPVSWIMMLIIAGFIVWSIMTGRAASHSL